tara:strand:- start:539 stop:4069 length:3531 start_codon:yes stop_codon:yes gene_type:complete
VPIFSNPQNKLTELMAGDTFAGYETGFGENFSAEYNAFKFVNTHRAEQDSLMKYFDPIIKELGDPNIKNPGYFYDALNGRSTARATGRLPRFYANQIDEAVGGEDDQPYFEFSRRLGILNDALEAQGKATISREQALQGAKDFAIGAQKDADKVQSQSTTLGDIGTMAGASIAEMRALLRSPFAPTLVMGASSRASVVGGALIDGLIVAGPVALSQPQVAKWRKSIGLGYDANQFFFNVGMAFGGGAAFSGALRGAMKGAPVVRDRMDPLGAVGREYAKNVDEMGIAELNEKLINLSEKEMRAGIEALQKAGVDMPPEVDIALRADDADEASLLDPNDLDAQAEHIDRTLKAELALLRDEPINMPHEPVSPKRVPDDIHHYDNLDDTVFRLDLDRVKVDAKTFQFKSGGDTEGVIETLQGIKKWDPYRANTVIVYEFADGRQFIADGHQRFGLAKRLKAADPEANINLYGLKLREADGVTPEQARVVAALANISQGSGTVVDAAKVLRVDPGRIGELPPMSQMVRQARELVKLSDESFGLVVNEIVPTNYAAIVGRLIDDPAKQMAVMRLLAKAEPANATQAEAIVRQARDMEFRAETQDGLFGVEEMTSSLMLERAKVLDQTLKILKNDKRVFKSLVDNQQRIEAEGNQLSADSNVQRSTTDGQALEIVQAQANRKGAISDALNLAAREYAEGKSLAQTSRAVADAVRSAIDRGDLHGTGILSEGRRADIAPEGDRLAASAERESLEQFDEPNGKGSQDQADASETTLREETEITEAAQPDVELRKDLGRIVDQGATPEQIDAHPAITDALEQAMAIPLTKEADGYGSDAWRAGREFRFGDETVVGYEAGVQRLYENAKRLGWEDDGKTFPGQIEQGRRATIMLGPPASGKSYFANKVAQARNAAIVDSDEAKAVLPEFQGGIGANAVHAESTTLAELVMRQATTAGDNIVIPRTGRTVAEIQTTIDGLRTMGYEVDIILMQVSADTAYRRMISRFIEKGRLIPPDYIRAVGDNPQLTYNAVKTKADRYATIENESPIDSAKGVLDEGQDSPLQEVDIRLRRGSEESGPKLSRVGQTERTAQGEQQLIEGVEPVTDATRAQAAVDAPLTGGVRPMDEGLFDTGARSQMDLLDMAIPVGQRIDDAGETVAETQSIRSMFEEFDNDKMMLDRLKDCV